MIADEKDGEAEWTLPLYEHRITDAVDIPFYCGTFEKNTNRDLHTSWASSIGVGGCENRLCCLPGCSLMIHSNIDPTIIQDGYYKLRIVYGT